MLRLRPYKPQDGDVLLRWFSGGEEAFEKWSAGQFSYPLTREQMDSYFRKWEDDEWGWPMAAIDEKGRLAGHLLMRSANYRENSLFFGFIVVDPSVRGKGLGKEMISLALAYAFEILKVDAVRLRVFANNPAAKACYEAAGFRVESFTKEAFAFGNQKWDNFQMIACREEWEKTGR